MRNISEVEAQGPGGQPKVRVKGQGRMRSLRKESVMKGVVHRTHAAETSGRHRRGSWWPWDTGGLCQGRGEKGEDKGVTCSRNLVVRQG